MFSLDYIINGPTEIPQGMKQCGLCERVLEKTEENYSFEKDKPISYCKPCRKVWKKLYDLLKADKYKEPKYTRRAENAEYRKTHKDIVKQSRDNYYHKNKKKLKARYNRYKGGAKYRNIKFNLTLDEFSLFWEKPCTYCNNEILTIGLDRIDSHKGYSIDNITSCCITCNKMKLNHTLSYFIEHCKKVTNFNP